MIPLRLSGSLAIGTIVVLAMAMDGCATKAGTAAAAAVPSPPGKEDCLWFRTLDDWSPVDRDRLIIYGPGRVPYLATLAFPSPDINWNFAIGFLDRDHDGRLCGGFDEILLRDSIPDRINIVSLKRIEKADAKALLEAVDPRHRTKKIDKSLKPKDGDGNAG